MVTGALPVTFYYWSSSSVG